MGTLGRHMSRWVLLGAVLMVSSGLSGVLVGVSAATALEVGEKAPDFTLPSTTGNKISLSQFRGKELVLIEFYVGESPT